MNAKKVAKKLHCSGARRVGGGAPDPSFQIKDGVVCLIGRSALRVNVITFKRKRGQTRWEDSMLFLGELQGRPQYWASADGVTVVARDGNRAAACAGWRQLKGARHRGVYGADERGWWRIRC